MKKKLFSRIFSLKLSSAKVKWNDDNLAGNNLGKSPKISLSMPGNILQNKIFWYKNFLGERSSGHIE